MLFGLLSLMTVKSYLPRFTERQRGARCGRWFDLVYVSQQYLSKAAKFRENSDLQTRSVEFQ